MYQISTIEVINKANSYKITVKNQPKFISINMFNIKYILNKKLLNLKD